MAGPSPTPQVVELVHRGLSQTVHDVKWLPGTANFVALGCQLRGTGILQVFQLDGTELRPAAQAEQPTSLKCGVFGAGAAAAHLAVGNFAGQLQLLDLEQPGSAPLFSVQAHRGIVNALDTCGSQDGKCGPPAIATAGADGGVRVWDPRAPAAPSAAFLPAAGAPRRDCWCVAFGDAHSGEGRCLLAGYENGDVKMFDLRAGSAAVRWETNVGKGVCSLQFDRRDIPMNKFVATCLEAQLCLFDARTQHLTKGFAARVAQLRRDATLWGVQHVPQNRDLFMVTGGDGSLALHKYHYPDRRAVDDGKGQKMGVAGEAELICDRCISSQPVSGFDWSPDKAGLFVAAAFDQTVRVGMVSQLAAL